MIRTVTGDIEKESVENALMHEHIQCVSNDMLHTFGKDWLDDAELENYSVDILGEIKDRYNMNLFVDGTAVDLGRNVRLMKRVSEKTGIHIVASAGLYYYPSMLTCMRSEEDLADLFIKECECGMEGTGIKPGILKCAGDSYGMTADTKKRISALAITQAKTNLPIYAHCSHTDNLAFEMMSVFEKYNVNPEKVILGHASRRMDVSYLESLLKHGCYICIDQSWSEIEVASVTYELCNRGYAEKILFSHDKAIYNDFERVGNIGTEVPKQNHTERLSFVFSKVIPKLEEYGLNGKLFTHDNAVSVLDI